MSWVEGSGWRSWVVGVGVGTSVVGEKKFPKEKLKLKN